MAVEMRVRRSSYNPMSSPSMSGEGPNRFNGSGRVAVPAGKFASVLLIRMSQKTFLFCSNREVRREAQGRFLIFQHPSRIVRWVCEIVAASGRAGAVSLSPKSKSFERLGATISLRKCPRAQTRRGQGQKDSGKACAIMRLNGRPCRTSGEPPAF
jgi:hypothetical protein